MTLRPFFSVICLMAVAISAAAKAPDWVKKRPASDSCYIGIGSAPTSSADYEQTAREKALADLISQIQVLIENESLLKRIDENGNYSERYTDDIRSRSKAWLEDYEVVDTYNDGHTYWLFCRIGKERYAELKRAKARDAALSALDYWKNGNEALKSGDFTTAAKMYTSGIRTIEPFSDMRLIVDAEQTMNIAMELQMSLAKMFGEFQMQSTPSTVIIKQFDESPTDVLILVRSGIHPLANIPLKASSDNRKAKVTVGSATDSGGHARINITGIAEKGGPWTLTVAPQLDVRHMFDTPALEAIYATLSDKIQPIHIKVSIADSGLKAVCHAMDPGAEELTRQISAFLNKSYFYITDNPAEADLEISVKAEFSKGETIKNDLNELTKYNCTATVYITDVRKQAKVITVTATGDAGLPQGKPESRALKTAAGNAMKKLRKELEIQLKNKNFSPRVRRQNDEELEVEHCDFFDDEYK